jgi:7,8-dihydropterin-6-yl-methyl-4-(beta-D-ribofuranosyl)aminobenzene 5'-phosphate synthase
VIEIWENKMIKKLKITILCENRVTNPQLVAEQGLSLLIETPGGKILFDTGQTDTVVHNAKSLKLKLNEVTKIVLSHGHFDMAGGLPQLLREISKPKIYCHPNLFNKKFKLRDNERIDIGVPWEKSDIEELGANFILKTRPLEILPDAVITGEIPRLTSYESINEIYQEQILESYIHDELHDDIALILKTQKGLILLLGCGHSGAINTIKYAMRLTGENRIHLVMGGMHLQQASDKRITEVVNNLISLEPDYIAPLHCCGFRCINQFYNQIKNRTLLFNVGDSFSFN